MEAEQAMIGGDWEAKHNHPHRELLQDAAIIEKKGFYAETKEKARVLSKSVI